jgi:TolB-like protein/class 3 adenylate cyclase/Tfp pilus assembly protein PilF
MPKNRQLAAIMFSDIEGYTSIMQENEKKAIALRNRYREILQRRHENFKGRIIQYYGDGTLSIFPSAINAVACALAMQQEFRRKPIVPVRMGIHSGDIIFDEEQVVGDGVNIASRVESLGIAGSVLLSDKIQDELKNHPEFDTVSIGSFQFKNVERIIEVFALKHHGLVAPASPSLEGKLASKNNVPVSKTRQVSPGSFEKSIAVLPFINLSSDPDQEYFSEGVGEEILNSLSKLEDLKVASRSASFQFSGRNIDLNEVKNKLGVSTVLHGSIRKQGQRLRLMVQLINVEDGFHLWSEKYDRDLDDVFAIQDEIALAITEKLKGTLLEQDRALITKTQTHNVEAYKLFLKGRFHMNKRGASILIAIHCFQLAIDLDPEFALAHVGYADANMMAGFYALLPPGEVVQKARKAAQTALQLAPDSCEPYCSLGCLYTCFEWNWKAAEKYFLRSFEINPKYAQAHFWYGSLYLAWAKGDFLGAITHGRIAVELEPLSPIALGMYGSILYSVGQFQESIQYCKQGIEQEADSFSCHLFMGMSYLAHHEFEKGLEVLEQLSRLTNRFHLAENALIIGYCMAWKFKKARELMQELRIRQAHEYVAFTLTGVALAHLDELDEAFICLEKAFAEREPLLLALKYQSWIPDSLKADPRYNELLKKIGFP